MNSRNHNAQYGLFHRACFTLECARLLSELGWKHSFVLFVLYFYLFVYLFIFYMILVKGMYKNYVII